MPLGYVNVFEHGLLRAVHRQQREQGEQHQGRYVDVAVGEREALEDVELVDHPVVAKREEVGETLYDGVHGGDGEGGAADAHPEHAPERTDTHRHAQGGHQSEDEDAEAFARQHHQEREQQDGGQAARVGKVEMAEDIDHIAEEDRGEDQKLWEKLSRQGHDNIITREAHPVTPPPELQFRTDGIDGNEEYEDAEDARHHDAGEVDVVVGPWIAGHVEVDGDGLQKTHDLLARLAQHLEFRLAYRGSPEGRDRLEVAKDQVAREHYGRTIIERDVRLLGSQQVGCHAVGKEDETIDLAPLDGLARVRDAGVVVLDLGRLETVEAAHHGPCHLRPVLVHDAHGQLCRLPLVEDGGEKKRHHDREHHHAEQVDRIAGYLSAFPCRYAQRPHQYLARFHACLRYGVMVVMLLYFVMCRGRILCRGRVLCRMPSGCLREGYRLRMMDMPGRRPSIFVSGRAFTSKVFKSYCPVVLVAFHTA